MPIQSVPLTEEDRQASYYRLKGSLMAVAISVLTLAAVVCTAIYFAAQVTSLHYGLRIGLCVLLMGVLISSVVYYRNYVTRIYKDLHETHKAVLTGIIMRGVFVDEDQPELNCIEVNIGGSEDWVKVDMSQLRIASPKLYQDRLALRVGDFVYMEYSANARVLMKFRRLTEDDYAIFFDESLYTSEESEEEQREAAQQAARDAEDNEGPKPLSLA